MGSNQYSAVVVELAPRVRMSVSLSVAMMICPDTWDVVVANAPPPPPPVPAMVIGDDPITLKPVQVIDPEQVTEVVATFPNDAGEPDVLVQYARLP